MSTWTSKALLALVLATPAAAQDGFRLAAPSGFCVVEDSRQSQAGSTFAAFAPCAKPGLFGSAKAAVLTATVGGPASALGIDLTAQGLAAFFTGPEGKRALSRVGDARSVIVHDVHDLGDAVVVRWTDRSTELPEALGAGQSWRAVLAVQGRLVTLTAQTPRDGTLTSSDGRAVIRRFVAAMRSANGG